MGYYLTEKALAPCQASLVAVAIKVYVASYGVSPKNVDVSLGLKQVLVSGSEGTELYTFEDLGF